MVVEYVGMCLVLNTGRSAGTDWRGTRVHEEMESDSEHKNNAQQLL